jgi:hypothetical protein
VTQYRVAQCRVAHYRVAQYRVAQYRVAKYRIPYIIDEASSQKVVNALSIKDDP